MDAFRTRMIAATLCAFALLGSGCATIQLPSLATPAWVAEAPGPAYTAGGPECILNPGSRACAGEPYSAPNTSEPQARPIEGNAAFASASGSPACILNPGAQGCIQGANRKPGAPADGGAAAAAGIVLFAVATALVGFGVSRIVANNIPLNLKLPPINTWPRR